MLGREFGAYRIEELIGKGGMGVVYRARDRKLERSVAIKLLPEQCARDPELRSRFEREARALAALNHAHVAAIYGLYEFDGLCGLVLEYVPGDTLAARIDRGAIPWKHALAIAVDIAEAVEAAHAKGIIHRDLKPGNIKLTPEDQVKVLDFGLAKILEDRTPAPEDSTETLPLTTTHAVLGTPSYMSPEQAQGKSVDRRTDVWAFGCVLYEMLTRRRAFPGASTSDRIAAVITKEPDWNELPRDLDAGVRRLLRRCLEKDPHKRLCDIGDARIELEEALTAPADARENRPAPPKHRGLLAAGYLGAGAAAAWLAVALLRPAPPAPPVTRFAIRLAREEVVAPLGASVRLAPDGRRLAWVGYQQDGRTQIYYRHLAQIEAKAVEGTTGGTSPVLSPDGKWISFLHPPSRTLKKVALAGGAPLTICPVESANAGVWAAGDDLFFTSGYPGAVVRVSAAGGNPQAVTKLDQSKDERTHGRAVLLSGGKAVLFVVGGGGMDTYDDARIAVQSLATGERKDLIEGGMAPQYSPTGHIIYARGGKLLAVPFDAKRLALTGPPETVLDGVFMCVNTGAAHYSLSADGTLAYAPGIVLGGQRQLMWVDRSGHAEPLPVPARAYLHPRLSPDGKRLAVEIEGPVHDFWTCDLERGVMSKVTLEGSSHWPLWTPDGQRFTYRRWIGGHFSMWSMPTDRSAPPERITDIGRMQSASSWSPDGRVVAFTQVSLDTGADVFVLDSADSGRTPRPFAQTRFAEGAPRFSPDGRWIAYISNESGRNEVYAQAYPGPGAKIQVSTEGGTDAVWRRLGGELYYRNGDRMMAVQVSTSGAFQASRPKLLWTGHYAHGLGSACGPPGTTSSNYDVTADGQRFLMVKHDEAAPAQINVVMNWTEELKNTLRR